MMKNNTSQPLQKHLVNSQPIINQNTSFFAPNRIRGSYLQDGKINYLSPKAVGARASD